ncbi:TRAP transporter substrate-binding protein [Oceanobacillus saliphilus]|uniref:TRAP transporter substrate-binding protein n=1 Tax=Oceanobacillus saliphilus TaxID=2925834 RepID=UPI00201DA84B|nr:TRAP transporter substrate-binding protein DctP [Oceanobacillus saliphilus]
MLLKKQSVLTSCLILLFLILSGCSSASEGVGSETSNNTSGQKGIEVNNDVIRLKLATWNSAETFLVTEFLEPFMERVTDLTEGQVQFEFYPGQQLGNAADSLRMVQSGIADISHFTPPFTPYEMPLSVMLSSMPGLYETTTQGAKAYNKVARQEPIFENEFLNHGVRPLSLAFIPVYDMMTDGKEVKVPEDLKGLKIKATGDIFSGMVTDLGATPVSLSPSDFYTAFNTGVVDAFHFPYASAEKYGILELVEYAVLGLNMGSTVEGLIINEEVYQSLPSDIQEILLQEGEELGIKLTEYQESLNFEIFQDLVESEGVTTHELTEDEKDQWKNYYDEFNRSWIEKLDNEDAKKVLEMFQKEVEK